MREPVTRNHHASGARILGFIVIIIISVVLIIFTNSKVIQEASLGEALCKYKNLVDFWSSLDSNQPSTPGKDNEEFQIKHIFHHGTGPESYRIHRRFDVTDLYLKNLKSDPFEITRQSVDSNDLEGIYNQLDWPEVHRNSHPLRIKLPIRKASQQGRTKRLKERHKPGFIESYLEYAIQVKGNKELLDRINLEWEDETDIAIPDIEDKDTLVSLATISSNAYVKFPEDEKEKKKSDWRDIGDWNPDDEHKDIEFGWDKDGVRGHVFVSNDNKTVVIGIKGTSGASVPGSGDSATAPSDKVNDNLLFSCCCARVSYLWTTVCDCYEGTYKCNQDCIEKELVRVDRYYQAVMDIYKNVTNIYSPEDTDIWVTGHSLGGSLASLVGRTFGLPVVAFEAPGELLATQRLHLPQAPGLPSHMENIWHIGNTGDPLYLGVCNGASSSCSVAGYAMETACHTGKQCVYDVVTDLGWSVSLLNHRIHTVIDQIILEYNKTPPCIPEAPCKDCFNWKYTSHDDIDDGDEPELPNPLLPHTSGTTKSCTKTSTHSENGNFGSTSEVSSGTSSTEAAPSKPPEKCLRRTWYGRCTEWGPEPEN